MTACASGTFSIIVQSVCKNDGVYLIEMSRFINSRGVDETTCDVTKLVVADSGGECGYTRNCIVQHGKPLRPSVQYMEIDLKFLVWQKILESPALRVRLESHRSATFRLNPDKPNADGR